MCRLLSSGEIQNPRMHWNVMDSYIGLTTVLLKMLLDQVINASKIYTAVQQ